MNSNTEEPNKFNNTITTNPKQSKQFKHSKHHNNNKNPNNNTLNFKSNFNKGELSSIYKNIYTKPGGKVIENIQAVNEMLKKSYKNYTEKTSSEGEENNGINNGSYKKMSTIDYNSVGNKYKISKSNNTKNFHTKSTKELRDMGSYNNNDYNNNFQVFNKSYKKSKDFKDIRNIKPLGMSSYNCNFNFNSNTINTNINNPNIPNLINNNNTNNTNNFNNSIINQQGGSYKTFESPRDIYITGNNNINNTNKFNPFKQQIVSSSIDKGNISNKSNNTNNNTIYSNNQTNNPNQMKNSHYSPNSTIKPNLHNKLNNMNSIMKNSFCPFCEHCNKLEDKTLDSYVSVLNETKSIINSTYDYILSSDLLKRHNVNVFSLSDNKDTLQSQKENIESILNNFPIRSSSSRTVYQVVSKFLNALIDEKMDLNKILAPEIIEKLELSLISQGRSFDDFNPNNFILDEEIKGLLDPELIKTMSKLFNDKYTVSEDKKYINVNFDNFINNNLKQEKKKFILMFSIFISILNEIYFDHKEKAILLYKFFKYYFLKLDKKYILIMKKMSNKIQYYKNLAKALVIKFNSKVTNIENISEILFENELSEYNLKRHKEIIQNTMDQIKIKQNEIYLLNSNYEILEKEAKTFVYGFCILKKSKSIRTDIKNVNIEQIKNNVENEVKNKLQLNKEQIAALINSDIFLVLSGQRNYFYDQKAYYLNEISRLQELYTNCNNLINDLRSQSRDKEMELDHLRSKLESELYEYKQRDATARFEKGTQTEISKLKFKIMEKNHSTIELSKKLEKSKLEHFIEKINYGISIEIPISKKSLLYLIPELLVEKLESDNRMDLEGHIKYNLDEFFYVFMYEKFKLKKLIKKHIEETILSIFRNCDEDFRINLIRRFLTLSLLNSSKNNGLNNKDNNAIIQINKDNLRREILDVYLILLKALPVSFYKIYDEEYYNYLISIDFCFEIYHSKLQEYDLIKDTRDIIIKCCYIYSGDKEIGGSLNNSTDNTGNYAGMPFNSRIDYFYICRFFSRSYVFVNDLINEYKNGEKTSKEYIKLIDQFVVATKEFNISENYVVNLLTQYFGLNQTRKEFDIIKLVNIQSKKYVFKMKLSEFIEETIKRIIHIHQNIEEKIVRIYESFDKEKNNRIEKPVFNEIINSIYPNNDNKWKVNEYFLLANNNNKEKMYVSKLEFLYFAMNAREVFNEFLRKFVGNKIVFNSNSSSVSINFSSAKEKG